MGSSDSGTPDRRFRENDGSFLNDGGFLNDGSFGNDGNLGNY